MAAVQPAETSGMSSTAHTKAQDPALSSSQPAAVEMNDLSSRSHISDSQQQQREELDTAPGAEQTPHQQNSLSPPDPSNRLRAPSETGLGPATDLPIVHPPPSSTASTNPTLAITLMLTTGARHPYKIDEKYLKNRKVDASSATGAFDPREISGYKLKELIWTDWRSEWEPRPVSPSSIRLIILGRLLEDKSPLRDFPFKLDDTNVVHMTVKPADFLDDDDTGGKGTGKGHSLRGRDGEERGAGCRCVIL